MTFICSVALAKYRISEMVILVILPYFLVLEGVHTIPHSAIPEGNLGQGKVGSTSWLL